MAVPEKFNKIFILDKNSNEWKELAEEWKWYQHPDLLKIKILEDRINALESRIDELTNA